ncbi:hypothetical protein GGI19_000275 [Coemansia pectinata]|uniref:HMG box domain-containing protein n=1 Tax=Coemansia pectinata TaxID=1052879 RepID=A0A9W8GZV9_9FUNG|nr:hypothetical protein GGI19_000275 [Coemansia pectinata]
MLHIEKTAKNNSVIVLADAFTAIADVFDLVGTRAVPVERTHDTAEPVERDHDTAEPVEVPQSDEELERELGPKPTLPTSASNMYRSSVISDIRKENPGIQRNEAQRLARIRWKNLSEEDRRPFKDRYDARNKQYKIDKAAYAARLKACMQAESGGSVSTARHAETRSLTPSDGAIERALGPKPKTPKSISTLYHRDHAKAISALNPDLSYDEVRQLADARWKNVSDEERQQYKDRYRALYRQYKIDIAAYDARVQALISTAYGEPNTPNAVDKVLERELGPKPKPPEAAHHMYRSSVISDIRKENPGIGAKGVEKISDLRWKNLSEEDRRPFKDRHDTLTKQYKIDKAAYDARKVAFLSTSIESVSTARTTEPGRSTLSISPDPLPQSIEQLNELEATQSDEELERELGPKPKHPTSATNMYRGSVINDIRKENPGINTMEARRLAAIRWKNLSEEDRRPFKDRHDALKKQYKIDKAAYDARESVLVKTSVCKLGESRGNCVANTSDAVQPSQHLASSISPGLPPQPTGCLNGPEYTTTSVSSRFTGLLSSQPLPPPPIESFSSPCPVGYPTSSHSILPSGTASWPTIPPGLPWPALTPTPVSWPALPLGPVPWLANSPSLPWPALPSEPVSWPANHSGPSLPAGSSGAIGSTHPLAISWPAEVTLPDESPSLSANSDGLPRPTMATEHPMSPIQENVAASATLAQPVVPPESIPVGMRPMSLEFPNTTETVAFVESPELSFSTDPPAADVKPSAESAEPAEPLTPTKTKSKKKKKKRATGDDGQSTSPQRKKAKRAKGDAKEGKKKHKPKIVVKTEDNI